MLFLGPRGFHGLCCKFRCWQGASEMLSYPETSSMLDVKPFTKDADRLRERTDTDAEGAFDDASFSTDVLGEVEDRRLTLA